jgi:uncharacterized protein (TIGR00299 family) protein
MKLAYLDCFSGISGDMFLGAMLDAGLSIEALSSELKKLKLTGYRISKSTVKRSGVSGTKFDVAAKSAARGHRPLNEILAIIDRSRLNGRVKDISKRIFTLIGEAEAKVHGVSRKSDIKFHELGDIDSIIDIVGAAIAADSLGIDEFHSSSVTLGRSFVKTRHGRLPIPAPAALELLKGVPTRISDVEAELVTPTGAGILKALCKTFGGMPLMDVSAVGYGAGTKDLQNGPNMLRMIMGEAARSFREDRISVIETNIDDMNPQNFEYLFERLLREGALDVYTTNISMKKSRPAFKLTVLSDTALLDKMLSVIFAETTAIGTRFYEVRRAKLDRKIVTADTKYGPVKVKVSGAGDKTFTASPEYDDCARLAREKKVPLKTIYDEAKRAI